MAEVLADSARMRSEGEHKTELLELCQANRDGATILIPANEPQHNICWDGQSKNC